MTNQEDSQQPARGRLRIYFGASSGVGKTHAMLEAARKLKADGQDVVIGAINTRGCDRIAGLCDGMERVPTQSQQGREGMSEEFDLDAALARLPAVLVIDDLSHVNGLAVRHSKRWQDVEELLDAGIDVFTTVNVQNLESLSNVVGDITGMQVSETVPDTIFDGANEIILVDVPVDELYARISSLSKPHRAYAVEAMRKGDLIALRELALRRTADRVEDDVQAYRIEKSVSPVWKTDAALLACIGPHSDEHVVRSAARLANQLNAAWHAVYVETPKLQRMPAARRDRILKTIKLAQELGANTAVLSGSDIALSIADYMRANNLSKGILGRSRRGWRKMFRPNLQEQIACFLPSMDLIEIGEPTGSALPSDKAENTRTDVPDNAGSTLDRPPSRLRRYTVAALASLFTAAISIPLLQRVELANIAMLYVLTVLLVAVRYGRGASVVATFIGVLAFIALMPKFSFAASHLEYSMTFMVMLAVGLITGKLTANLRYQARVAAHRESRATALYKFARALSGTLETEQIVETTRDFVRQTFHCTADIFLPDDSGRLHPVLSRLSNETSYTGRAPDIDIAQWSFDHSAPAGRGTDTSADNPFFYLPLVAPMRTRGILALSPESARWLPIPEQRRQLDTFAALAAIALERVHYVDVARDVLVKMESEKLRNSLLAAISHDLRTPLTSLVGLSESLTRSKPPLSPLQQELAGALRDESIRMNNLVSNLLEMARIQSGHIRLNLQWQPFEEVVGSALRICRPHLGQRQVHVKLNPDLPIVRFDAVLMERVLCNLLENGSKYTPPDAAIDIAAAVEEAFLEVTVSDNGPGLPSGQEEAIFEKFTRGDNESAIPGIGLGLAICRAIIEAHGGRIRAMTTAGGGASLIFTIPLGSPPDISLIEETESTSSPQST